MPKKLPHVGGENPPCGNLEHLCNGIA